MTYRESYGSSWVNLDITKKGLSVSELEFAEAPANFLEVKEIQILGNKIRCVTFYSPVEKC